LRDPGGRVGPMIGEKGEPDLRNLNVCHTNCCEGDIIIVVTDGIHDNLDPYYCGKTPKDIGITVEDNIWGNVKDEATVRSSCATTLLAEFMLAAHSIEQFVEKLVSHTVSITQKSREWMETQDKPLPSDQIQYPGKMDHATVICFQVGKLKTTNSSRNLSL